MEFFRFELQEIWQFEILEEQNSIFFSFYESLSVFIFFFFFFLDQRLAFENNEIRFRNH
jgi:hypothetical protein